MPYREAAQHERSRGETQLLGSPVAVFPPQLNAFSLAQPSFGYPNLRQHRPEDRSGPLKPAVDLPAANLFNFRRIPPE